MDKLIGNCGQYHENYQTGCVENEKVIKKDLSEEVKLICDIWLEKN